MSTVSIDTIKEFYGFEILDDMVLEESIDNYVNKNVNRGVNWVIIEHPRDPWGDPGIPGGNPWDP